MEGKLEEIMAVVGTSRCDIAATARLYAKRDSKLRYTFLGIYFFSVKSSGIHVLGFIADVCSNVLSRRQEIFPRLNDSINWPDQWQNGGLLELPSTLTHNVQSFLDVYVAATNIYTRSHT